ncbi:hypothetical protein [Brachybacterium saurashtrense]|uniref:Uncharacterized protein n=1 Tax=Brachybacterium saurashtrense TaxID=556288 RepID=A0A345YJS4_9MICO|nr:hypothetical protein [Brachybacterium saurashtrense]AXK44176.1 hypothetical protein DWV08_00060 [Brachybacterium saurashtrense]RRR21448.1 hypothetical protein DXU92_13960 [Brachybacterium saurashtrense]
MDGVPSRGSARRLHRGLAPSMVRDQPWRVTIALRTMAAHQHDDLAPGRASKPLTEGVPRRRDDAAHVMLPGLGEPPERR